MTNFPEHNKLRAISDKSQAIFDFLEWCEAQHGLSLRDHGGYIKKSVRDLLAEHFDIDQQKLEEEKLAMLEELRSR